MNANLLRRVNWLWKHRHTHDGEDFQEQITVIKETVETQGDVVAGSGSGAYIHLTRNATQSIAAVGELVEWDTSNPVIPKFEFLDSVPATEVTIPKAGYYDVSVMLGWASFTGGGGVSIRRNPSVEDEQVWPPDDDPGLWTTDSAQYFEAVAPAIPFLRGEKVGVFLDPDDASAQDLASASLAVYLVDRTTRDIFYDRVVLADGPIAYWRLDETAGTTAADSAGHASGPFDATYTNSPNLNQAGVMVDGSGSPSVDFSGTQHVLGQDWAALEFGGTAAFTVEAWISTDTVAAGQAIIVHKQVASSGVGWELIRSGSTVNFWRIGGAGSHSVAGGTLAVGVAAYVAATYDGTTLRLYVNGVEVDTDSTAISMGTNTVALSIARDSDGAAAAQFDGKIDEVAIYDRALTADQIAYHFQVGS